MNAHRHSADHGFTLVELLVGLALALLVVAGGGALLSSQIREHRALVLEARLMQDLRTAADLVARDLRRARYWGDAGTSVWREAEAPRSNPYAALAPADAASDVAGLSYSRDAVENGALDGNEQFGFRLRNRVIEIQLGSGNWQAMTDATLLAVTQFAITPRSEVIALAAACPTPCAEDDDACPRQQIDSFTVEISAHALADAAVARSVQALVRVRNDAGTGACPA